MRVLIDECLPRQLASELGAHEVKTVVGCGWAGVKNGVLLRLADPHFDVLVTADQSLYHQQNLAHLRIAVVVLPTNRLRDVLSAAPTLVQSLARLEPGRCFVLDLPPNSR